MLVLAVATEYGIILWQLVFLKLSSRGCQQSTVNRMCGLEAERKTSLEEGPGHLLSGEFSEAPGSQ